MAHLLLFGIAREVVGEMKVSIDTAQTPDIKTVKEKLIDQHPSLNDLASIRFAINGEYVDDQAIVNADDEVAIIPPVAGG